MVGGLLFQSVWSDTRESSSLGCDSPMYSLVPLKWHFCRFVCQTKWVVVRFRLFFFPLVFFSFTHTFTSRREPTSSCQTENMESNPKPNHPSRATFPPCRSTTPYHPALANNHDPWTPAPIVHRVIESGLCDIGPGLDSRSCFKSRNPGATLPKITFILLINSIFIHVWFEDIHAAYIQLWGTVERNSEGEGWR